MRTSWSVRMVGILGGFFTAAFFALASEAGATLYVPDQYPTIQAAIDVAWWSDLIIVTENVEGDFTVPSDLTDLKLTAYDRTIVSTGNCVVEGGLLVRDITLAGAIEATEGAKRLFLGGVNVQLGRFQGFTAYDGLIEFERCMVVGSGPGIFITGNADLTMEWTEVTGMQSGLTIQNTGLVTHDVVASLIYNNLYDGIRIDSANLNLLQTTVVGNGTTALVGQNLVGQSIDVQNCILAGESWTTAVDLNGELGYASVDGSVIYGDVEGVAGIRQFDRGRVSREDPLLTADYHLTPGSPAVGFGSPLVEGYPPFDLDWRLYSYPPSAGCYEYVPAN